MSDYFSTNDLLLRSDRIAFGKIPPEVPFNQERTLILPNTTGQYLYFGLSSMVSVNVVSDTLQAIYPELASFTFDNTNKRLGINVSTPQYALDIQTTTGVRISGGSLLASGTGLFSVPTAALFSTLPASVFAPGSIPPSALISSGSIAGLSVPTTALFGTLPTALFAPSTIPLVALQSSGIIVASSFVGDGYYLSNIPLANINGTITGSFFQPNTIPLSSLASTGQIWIRDSVGSIFAPIMSTGQFRASSIVAGNISSLSFQTGQLVTSSIQANIFQANTFAASNLSTINLKASSIESLWMVSTGRFFGDGQFITNLTPSQLNTVIPSDKFGYRLIAMDALNPYGDFAYEAGTWTFKKPVTVDIQGIFTVSSISGDGSQLTNIDKIGISNLVSTVVGLGTAGYLSTGAIGVLTTNLVSSLIGLGTFGYVSTSQLTSTVTGLGSSDYVSSLSLVSTTSALQRAGYLSTSVLTSTVAGLGSIGYVSTLSMNSSINAALSTFSTAFGPGGISVPNITSTVQGLGSAGYLSTLSSFNISTQNLFTSTITFLDIDDSSRQLLAVSSGVLLLNGQGITGTGGGGSLTQANLNSTIIGLGSYGYVSTLSLASSFISTTNALGVALSSFSTAFGPGGTNMQTLASTVEGLGTAGYVSTLSLQSSLVSTTQGLQAYISSFIDPSELASSVLQFISSGYLTSQLTSTVAGLGTAGYVSTLSLTSSFISTTNALGVALSSFSTAFGPGGTNMQTLASTVEGLGTAGYVSTLSLASSFISTTNFIALSFSSFSTAFGPGGGGSLTTANLTSTVVGLGTSGYVSTSGIVSSVAGLGTYGYISTIGLRSTVAGLGTAGYLSSTAIGPFFSSLSTAMRQNFNTVTSVISALTVSSLTFGVGDGFLAMPDIRPLSMSTLVTQTSSLQAFNLQIGATSTTTAIQFYGLLGNFNNTVLAERSIAAGAQEFLIFKGSSVADQVRIQTTGIFEIETGVSSRLWSTTTQNAVPAFLVDINSNVGIQTATPGATLDVAGTIRGSVVSTQQLNFSSIGNPRLSLFTVSTGFTSVSSLNMLDGFTNALNYLTVSSGTLLLNGSYITGSGGTAVTQIIAGQNISVSPVGGTGVVTINGLGPSISDMTSTVAGLGTAGYLSTLSFQSSLVSTTQGLQSYISSFIDPQELASSVIGFISTAYLTSQLTSTVAGLGTYGYVSTLSLVSTTLGLQMSGYLSTPTLTSTTAGLGTFGYISSLSLNSTVQGLGSVNYVSTLSLVSTTLGLQISGYLSTPTLTSTTAGLGTLGYISSLSLNSTVQGLGSVNYVSTLSLVSTTQGLQRTGYLSTYISSFLTLSTGLITTSSITLYDSRNFNSANLVYAQSTFLYFNNYIVAGTRQLQPQTFIF